MSDLSYLETLTNKELHAKCLEYGLPNIPVTDSSRKVILRRLRPIILAKLSKSSAASTKKTLKHETSSTKRTLKHETRSRAKAEPSADHPLEKVAITSNVSPKAAAIKSRVAKEKPEPKLKTSMKAASVTAKSCKRVTINLNASSPENKEPKYSSNRSCGTKTSTPLEETCKRTVETTTVSDVDSQSEDDDSTVPLEFASKCLKQQVSCSKRPVTLSKSGVMSTSYICAVTQPQLEDQETPQLDTYQRRDVLTAPSHRRPIYEPHAEPRYSSEVFRQNLTQTQVHSASYSEATDVSRTQTTPQLSPDNYSGSTAPFSLSSRRTSGRPHPYSFKGSGGKGNPLLKPTSRANTLYPQLNEFYEEGDRIEPMDVDTEIG